MFSIGLACSLFLFLSGALLGSSYLLGVSLVGVIASLAGLGGAPRRLLFLFWGWTTSVLLTLLLLPEASTDRDVLTLVGVPLPMLVMLAGIGIIPLLLWPIGFLLTFRDWLDE